MYLDLLSRNEMLLNFKEIMGISDTSKAESTMVKAIRKYTLCKILNIKSLLFKMKGREAIRKAFAGVGIPINESVWRVSILNLASLMAENMATRKARYGIASAIHVYS